MIKGLFFILLFYFIGDALSILIRGFIPGSVIGMILLFLSLFFKLLRPDYVRETATLITKNMAVFFVPATVGLMVYAEFLSNSIEVIASAVLISTVLTLVAVAAVQEYFENRRIRKKGHGKHNGTN
jgi:Putative effector of murein hydrolase LrgA